MSDERRALWKIGHELELVMNEAVDRETGEIKEGLEARLDELQIEKDEKCLAVAAYIKSLRMEAALLKAQGDTFRAEAAQYDERAAVFERQEARLLPYLEFNMEPGKKLSDATSEIKWRKSTAVEVDYGHDVPDEFLRVTTTKTVDKAKATKALKAGEKVPGCRLVERQKMRVE